MFLIIFFSALGLLMMLDVKLILDSISVNFDDVDGVEEYHYC